MPPPTINVTFATDSTLGLYGLGGPASHIARGLVRDFAPVRILASGDSGSGIPQEILSVRPPPLRNRIAGLNWRLRSLAEDAESSRLAFDRWSARAFPTSRVAVVENTTGLATLRVARERQARTVLMYYNRSFRLLLEDVEEERRRWGGPSTFLSPRLVERAEEECRLAGSVIGMSRLVLQDLEERGVEKARLRRAHYGVDTGRFTPSPKPEGPFIVAFVGWLAPWKGYPYLVEAFRDAAIPDSTLILHGGTDVEFHHELVQRLRGHSDVRVVKGPVEETYRRASLVVLPSVSDAYGLVGLEAMACGIPLIVTDRCGVAEDVIEGVNGYVVPARDSRVLKERILDIHSSPEIRRTMGIEGRKTALERPWERFSKEVNEVVRESL